MDKKLPRNRHWPLQNKCDEIGDLLYCQYLAEENSEGSNSEGCGDLMLEWIKSRFWGLLVRDHISTFETIYDILVSENNIGQKNRYIYGDIDVGIWVEKVKDPDKKVIASTRYCSCADDNTHLFILTKYSTWTIFRCRTVWPRQKSDGRGGAIIKFDHNIKLPSIATYRKRDFNFGYNDCRDKGHVFTYEFIRAPKLDNPHWNEAGIPRALWSLRQHLRALKDYEANKCY